MLIISNPNAGDKSGPALLKDVVLPFLERQLPSIKVQLKETTAPGDSGLLARDYLEKYSLGELQEDPVIMVSGGDTTVHEMIEKIASMPVKRRAKLVLIPSGTANAMYHSMFPPKSREGFINGLPSPLRQEAEQATEQARSKLYSVLCFLSNGPIKPLQGTRTSIIDKDDQVVNQNWSCVVVSSG
jgi:diacylglycerol kinase family enzyme